MCGISGFADWTDQVPVRKFMRSHGQLSHRGRDDEGFFVFCADGGRDLRGEQTTQELAELDHAYGVKRANAILGHRRLSVIDLSANGHQPMHSASGRYVITYNGEIYNYVELREDLEQLGYVFKTDSDTEVLLAALEEWGVECMSRLNGMWAFAVIDQKEQCLLLARDRLGIKPLYYIIVGRTLYFASEAKALLSLLPNVELNEQRAIEYVVSNYIDHHEQTMFKGVNQLLPGHYALWTVAGLQIERYWHVPLGHSAESFDEAIQTLRNLLTSSVTLRLRSDVPVGTLLSGGLDSTIIACLIWRRRQDRESGQGYDAFSAVFDEEAYSERRYIEETIVQTGLPIHWIYPRADTLEAELPTLLYYQEFPIRSLATFSQWLIMRQVANSHIKVLLNGQGSDELFAGYTQHQYALVVQYLTSLRLKRAWELLRFNKADGGASLLLNTRRLMVNLNLALLGGRRFPFSSPSYLNHSYVPEISLPRADGLLTRKLVQNLTLSALPEYLRYEDRNSMAFTLESRLPFLDYRLVEWAMSLPVEYKIYNGQSKRVLREAARPIIPAMIAERRDKMGFVSPQELWQRNQLKPMLDHVFGEDLQELFPFLDGSQVKHLYNRYQERKMNDWAWVWRVVCLYWWHKTWWG